MADDVGIYLKSQGIPAGGETPGAGIFLNPQGGLDTDSFSNWFQGLVPTDQGTIAAAIANMQKQDPQPGAPGGPSTNPSTGGNGTTGGGSTDQTPTSDQGGTGNGLSTSGGGTPPTDTPQPPIVNSGTTGNPPTPGSTPPAGNPSTNPFQGPNSNPNGTPIAAPLQEGPFPAGPTPTDNSIGIPLGQGMPPFVSTDQLPGVPGSTVQAGGPTGGGNFTGVPAAGNSAGTGTQVQLGNNPPVTPGPGAPNASAAASNLGVSGFTPQQLQQMQFMRQLLAGSGGVGGGVGFG